MRHEAADEATSSVEGGASLHVLEKGETSPFAAFSLPQKELSRSYGPHVTGSGHTKAVLNGIRDQVLLVPWTGREKSLVTRHRVPEEILPHIDGYGPRLFELSGESPSFQVPGIKTLNCDLNKTSPTKWVTAVTGHDQYHLLGPGLKSNMK